MALGGAYCLNCHASAERLHTFASLDNVLTAGMLYRHFAAPAASKAAFDDFSGAEHGEGDNDEVERAALADAQQEAWAFTPALPVRRSGPRWDLLHRLPPRGQDRPR